MFWTDLQRDTKLSLFQEQEEVTPLLQLHLQTQHQRNLHLGYSNDWLRYQTQGSFLGCCQNKRKTTTSANEATCKRMCIHTHSPLKSEMTFENQRKKEHYIHWKHHFVGCKSCSVDSWRHLRVTHCFGEWLKTINWDYYSVQDEVEETKN